MLFSSKEKKKEIEDDYCDNQEHFLIVNRDPQYLKNEALKFLETQEDAKTIVKRIDMQDWQDYADYVLSKIIEEDKKKKIRRDRAKRKKKLQSKPKISSYVAFNLNRPTIDKKNKQRD